MSASGLSADLIHLVTRDGAGARVRLGGCRTVVALRAFVDGQGVVQVAHSHWIRPPDAARAVRPRAYAGIAPGRALGAAIGELAFHFHQGLRDGHAPDESWFVPVPMLVGGERPRVKKTTVRQESAMAKGQKKSNREVRKPKTAKAKPSGTAKTSFLEPLSKKP